MLLTLVTCVRLSPDSIYQFVLMMLPETTAGNIHILRVFESSCAFKLILLSHSKQEPHNNIISVVWFED